MPADEATTRSGPIDYIALPRYTWRASLKHGILGGAAALIVLGIWAAVEPAHRDLISFMIGGWLIGLPIVLMVSSIMRSERTGHIDSTYRTPLSDVIIQLDSRLGTMYWSKAWWSWHEFVQSCTAAGIDRPRTIVDERLRSRLEEIERPAVMLEPEPILQSSPAGRVAIIFTVGFYFIFTFLQISVGNYLFAGVFAVMTIGIAASYPPVRDNFRNLRLDEGSIVAGVGSLSHKSSSRWTVNDAVMLVQSKNGRPPLYVSFVGEAGYKVLTFTDERDPDFVKLWQRWNHPKPRPELVVE